MTVQIPVTLTDAEYRALATIAARNETQVHVLIEMQIRRCISPEALATALAGARAETPAPAPDAKPTPGEVQTDLRRQRKAAVREAHARGLNDMQISQELGYPYSTVYTDRRDMGLHANHRGRPRKVVVA